MKWKLIEVQETEQSNVYYILKYKKLFFWKTLTEDVWGGWDIGYGPSVKRFSNKREVTNYITKKYPRFTVVNEFTIEII